MTLPSRYHEWLIYLPSVYIPYHHKIMKQWKQIDGSRKHSIKTLSSCLDSKEVSRAGENSETRYVAGEIN